MVGQEFWFYLLRTFYPVHCNTLGPGRDTPWPLTGDSTLLSLSDNLLSSWLVTISGHNLSFLTLFPDHWSLCSSCWRSQDPAKAVGNPHVQGPLPGPWWQAVWPHHDTDSGSPTSPFWTQKPVHRRQSVRQSLSRVSHMDCGEGCLTTYTDHHHNLSSSSQHHFINKTSSTNIKQQQSGCVILSSQSTKSQSCTIRWLVWFM